ncbi:MAG: methyltransferase domain-containing protein [Planctomycetota bacterium]|nr:MAG: methyltransferase domain-containing protein [Planctomycetota bacterium]REJ93517.1 MAG: methyltransferase domain-containing protein [Planctomycetota bacterium]
MATILEPHTQHDAATAPLGNRTAECLNLGCGSRFVPSWTNVDIRSRSPHVIAHDLRRPLPFPDASFDFVYTSHVLEHFDRDDGETFLHEAARMLRPGGILRVVVPDVEQLARVYLDALQRADEGQPGADADYQWSLLMLFDQMLRDRSGGAMGDYLRQAHVPNRDFVVATSGTETESLMDRPVKQRRGLRRLFSRGGRERLWRRLFGSRFEAYRAGRFRQGGEIHRWMYDRYSLRQLFERCGLGEVRRCAAAESRWPGFHEAGLDIDSEGRVYKPESIYMEGVQPY